MISSHSQERHKCCIPQYLQKWTSHEIRTATVPYSDIPGTGTAGSEPRLASGQPVSAQSSCHIKHHHWDESLCLSPCEANLRDKKHLTNHDWRLIFHYRAAFLTFFLELWHMSNAHANMDKTIIINNSLTWPVDNYKSIECVVEIVSMYGLSAQQM